MLFRHFARRRRSILRVATHHVVRSLVEPLEARRLLTTAGQWDFDAAPNDLVADASGNGHALALVGDAAVAAGTDGTVLTLDGQGDFAVSPGVVNAAAGFAFAAWVNADSSATGDAVILSQSGLAADQFVLARHADSAGVRFSFDAADNDGASGATVETNPIPPSPDVASAWTFVAAAYDASLDEISLYVDGALQGTAPYTTGNASVAGAVRVGATVSPNGTPENAFAGDVDGVRVTTAGREIPPYVPQPRAPELHLQVDAVDDVTVTLSWDDLVTNETSFEVRVTPAGGAAFLVTAPAQVGTGRAGVTVEGLSASTAYTFAVRPVFGGDAAYFSKPATVTTSPAATAGAWSFAYKMDGYTNGGWAPGQTAAPGVTASWDAYTSAGLDYHHDDTAELTLTHLPRHAYIEVYAGTATVEGLPADDRGGRDVIASVVSGNQTSPVLMNYGRSGYGTTVSGETFNTAYSAALPHLGNGFAVENHSDSAKIRFTGINFGTEFAWALTFVEIRIYLPEVALRAVSSGGEGMTTKPSFQLQNMGDDYLIPIPVEFEPATGTATKGTDWTLTLPPGTSGAGTTLNDVPATITVPGYPAGPYVNLDLNVTDDTKFEPTETVVTALKSKPWHYQIEVPGPVSVNIEDNDTPIVSVVATDDAAAETFGDVPVDPGNFTISRTGETTDPLDVYFTVGGSATEGDGTTGSGDYDRLPGSVETSGYVHHVTIPAGQSGKTFSVTPVKDDPTLEGEDTVVVALTPAPVTGGPTPYLLSQVPATGPTTQTVTIRDGEVGADDNQAGVKGGEVPSVTPKFAVKHFVSPKAANDQVILKAGVPAGKQFGNLYTWVGGDVVPGSPEKRAVKRDTPGRYDVQLVDIATTKPVFTFTVWVVWVDITATQTQAPQLQVRPVVAPPGGVANGPGARVGTTWEFEGTIEPANIITDADRPDLTGAPTSKVPHDNEAHVLDAAPYGQPALKWDISRQVRLKILSPTVGTNDIQQAAGTIWANLPAPNKTIQTNPNPGADDYPLDEREGNDDGGAGREDDDPHNAPAIGKLTDSDPPAIPSVLDRAGAVNDTIELRAHFREFARLEINGMWYRVSDFSKWRFHSKMKKAWAQFGRDGAPGDIGLDDDGVHGVDDAGELGMGDDDDKNKSGGADALAGGGSEGHWENDNSVSDATNNGW